MPAKNILYYGDNLKILKLYLKDETVDLIYLDPPFKSNQDYNILFTEPNGSQSEAQIKVFEDTWHWGQESAETYQEVVELGGKTSRALQAFRKLFGENDMLAYLSMMAPRLIELKRVLKPTGSIYLHCDPTASAHLRILMDAIFGEQNFQNEIVWCYKTGGATKKRFARKHDILLFYSKDADKKIFNLQKEKSYMRHKYGFKKSHFQEDEQGQYSWVIMKDWWEISTVGSADKQRLGYPTQKPEALLERIIKASSNEGDIVLDPFCGCGTSICVAQKLNRHWIGIDITHLAVTLIKHRIRDTFPDNSIDYKVIGEPITISEAKELAKQNPYQFQWWALGLVGARPVEQKKGADKGIDGCLYFHDEGRKGKTKQIIFSVKSGHVSVSHIRDLRGVIEREKAEIGVLITMNPPTKQMEAEAASSGYYVSKGWSKRYPRIQILTIEDLLGGKNINYPPSKITNVTFKKAPKEKKEKQDNPSSLFK